MTTRGRTLEPRLHLSLRHLSLCLDCDECFEFGPETCPACGSATWASLSRFLEQAAPRRPRRLDWGLAAARAHNEQPKMVRQVIIVARDQERLYEHLKRAFAGNETVRVVLNRRVAERRQRSGPRAAERRLADRRSPLKVDDLLRAMGLAVVPQEVPQHRRVAIR